MSTPRRVLVLGGYGLIGAEVVRHLIANGHTVRALGRNAQSMARVLPGVPAVIRDLRDMQTPADWDGVLADIDFVVNCSGTLQPTPEDDLNAVHEGMIKALVMACTASNCALVQISAVGAAADASTSFLASKARGDASIQSGTIDWWIFRPGLVLAPSGHGGTQLLRMLAAVPLIQPLALPDVKIQTVSVFDVSRAVALAVEGTLPAHKSFDLVEETPHRLLDLVASYRAWLGFAPARAHWVLPALPVAMLGKGADLLGRLGWRSPLRSTALRVLGDGVRGDPAPWRAAGGAAMPLAESLRAMPARAEDRMTARMALLMPVLVASLVLFWALSGVIGLMSLPAAAEVLTRAGWGQGVAMASVGFWALVDLVLAGALLVRRRAGHACWAMVAVCLIYLGAATLVAPWLWADPLGPLVKVIPALVLALVTRALLEVR